MCKNISNMYRLDAQHCLDYSCSSKVYLHFNQNRLYNNLTFLKKLFHYQRYDNNLNYKYLFQKHEFINLC